MDRYDEYRDNMSSPRSYDSQWSPPPRFQDIDHISEAEGSPHPAYSTPASPHGVSPPLHYEQHEFGLNSPPRHHEAYHEGYSTEKETPYTTHMALGTPTPDYSGPQVVPGQFHGVSQESRPLSPAMSHGGTTLASPYFANVRPSGFKEHVESPMDGPEAVPLPAPQKDNRKCGLKRRTFMILVGCVIIWVLVLALGLGLGLGLGLKKKNSSSGRSSDPICRENPQLCIGGALNADYFSKQGAFNGSGIALAGESWNQGQRRIFTLYFQHHSGDIRFMQYSTDRKWVGGTKTETVASDAKDASPISAVSYALNETQYFHIFYVSKNNTVKQATRTNDTDIWQSGPLSSLNLQVYDSPSTGLQACWKGSYYGDSDYTKFPTWNGVPNSVPFDSPSEQNSAMNIWFAVDDSTFMQYAWYAGQDQWVSIQPWRGFNGHAGVGCYSWGPGTTTYAMLTNKANSVEFYWKDTNTSVSSTAVHPINSWQNSSQSAIASVYPTTSLGYTTYFYAQMADRTIKGYNVTYAAENTTFVEDDTFAITDPAGPVQGLGGTHMTVTAYAERDASGKTIWDSLYVFFQTGGSDITAFTRPLDGGEWTRGNLVIPND